jgi:hypothetical protein
MKNAGGGQRTIRSAPNRDMARERSMFVSAQQDAARVMSVVLRGFVV